MEEDQANLPAAAALAAEARRRTSLAMGVEGKDTTSPNVVLRRDRREADRARIRQAGRTRTLTIATAGTPLATRRTRQSLPEVPSYA
jgi:gamma-glutamyl:cysteine ligase YbdK (ATP-grasp superfamily)